MITLLITHKTYGIVQATVTDNPLMVPVTSDISRYSHVSAANAELVNPVVVTPGPTPVTSRSAAITFTPAALPVVRSSMLNIAPEEPP
jgi:hypothetical protein